MTDLEEEMRSQLAGVGHFVSRPTDALLSVQGRPHHAMALILSGQVSINIHAHGDRIELARLGRGEVVGEMCVIDPRVASSTARVVSGPANLWIIERCAFDQFIEDHPDSGLILLKALGKVLCRRVRTDSELMLRKAEEMRSHFLDIDY
ncbi:MAG: Crp/Fnr family transcriptional regulator [Verrucomicrobiales bacterium]